MILLAKLFGIYFKNLFICIDEFVLQVPDILDILGRFFGIYYGLSCPHGRLNYSKCHLIEKQAKPVSFYLFILLYIFDLNLTE